MARNKQINSRAARRARFRKPRRRRSGSVIWGAVIALVVVLGVGAVWAARDDHQASADAAPRSTDHWHSYLGINLCGTWQQPWPAFDTVDGSPNVQTGIHAHADGNVHIHPLPGETGNRATLGRFFSNGGGSVSSDSIRLWDGTEYRSGDTCETGDFAGQEGVLQWTVDGEVQDGNPADYKLENAEIIAIYLLPEGAELTEPPGAREALIAPIDLVPPEGEAPGTPPPGEAPDEPYSQ